MTRTEEERVRMSGDLVLGLEPTPPVVCEQLLTATVDPIVSSSSDDHRARGTLDEQDDHRRNAVGPPVRTASASGPTLVDAVREFSTLKNSDVGHRRDEGVPGRGGAPDVSPRKGVPSADATAREKLTAGHAARDNGRTDENAGDGTGLVASTGPVAGAFTVESNAQEGRILFRTLTDARAAIPAEQMALYREIEEALAILMELNTKTRRPWYDRRFGELVGLAEAGLTGLAAQPALARQALSAWKARIVLSEEGRVKNEYLRKLGKSALMVAVPSLLVAWLTRTLPEIVGIADRQPLGSLSTYSNFALLLAGCALGVWLSFGARRTAMRFEELVSPEADRLDSSNRLLLAAAATGTLGLALVNGVLDLTLGKAAAATFAGDGGLALLLGILCGFAERTLGRTLGSQAEKVLPKSG